MKGLLLFISLTAAVSYGQYFDFDSKTFKERDIFRTYRVTFEPNKSNINKDSYRFLDSMVHFIMRNEELIIEIAYHREFFGEAYGKCLSCDRAEAISNYLISKGVPKRRLVPKGYGDSMPIVPYGEGKKNMTEEEYDKSQLKNRRTEFVIKEIVKPFPKPVFNHVVEFNLGTKTHSNYYLLKPDFSFTQYMNRGDSIIVVKGTYSVDEMKIYFDQTHKGTFGSHAEINDQGFTSVSHVLPIYWNMAEERYVLYTDKRFYDAAYSEKTELAKEMLWIQTKEGDVFGENLKVSPLPTYEEGSCDFETDYTEWKEGLEEGDKVELVGLFDNIRCTEDHCYGYALQLWKWNGSYIGFLHQYEGNIESDFGLFINGSAQNGPLQFTAMMKPNWDYRETLECSGTMLEDSIVVHFDLFSCSEQKPYDGDEHYTLKKSDMWEMKSHPDIHAWMKEYEYRMEYYDFREGKE